MRLEAVTRFAFQGKQLNMKDVKKGETVHLLGHLLGGLGNALTGPTIPWPEAKRLILGFLTPDFHKWPDREYNLFFGGDFLAYIDRICLVCFLFGNGCRDEWIIGFTWPRLRDDSARRHVSSILDAIRAGSYDFRWYYFNLENQVFYYLNGRRNTDRMPPQQFMALANAWEERQAQLTRDEGRYASLTEQDAFLGTSSQPHASSSSAPVVAAAVAAPAGLPPPSLPPSPPGASPVSSRAPSPEHKTFKFVLGGNRTGYTLDFKEMNETLNTPPRKNDAPSSSDDTQEASQDTSSSSEDAQGSSSGMQGSPEHVEVPDDGTVARLLQSVLSSAEKRKLSKMIPRLSNKRQKGVKEILDEFSIDLFGAGEREIASCFHDALMDEKYGKIPEHIIMYQDFSFTEAQQAVDSIKREFEQDAATAAANLVHALPEMDHRRGKWTDLRLAGIFEVLVAHLPHSLPVLTKMVELNEDNAQALAVPSIRSRLRELPDSVERRALVAAMEDVRVVSALYDEIMDTL